MADFKEIKKRIKSVSDTIKITNAMYLIASTKLSRSRRELNNMMPYVDFVKNNIGKMFEAKTDGKTAYLFITSEKGFAGTFNQNIFKSIEKILCKENDDTLFVTGECGSRYFISHSQREITYIKLENVLVHIKKLCSDEPEVSVHILYSDMHGKIKDEVIAPISYKMNCEIEYYPSFEEVSKMATEEYVSVMFDYILKESYCAEQYARMAAMNIAKNNAQKILEKLNREYNRMRQNAITSEITEISSEKIRKHIAGS